MIRLGLGLHGVIDKEPEFFSKLSKFLLSKGHEVYIVTGREKTNDLIKELKACHMIGSKVLDTHYTDILSITTYQKKLGTPISYMDDRKSQPIMDPAVWNPTKAALCATAGIDIMVDDSPIYGKYFLDVKTQYIQYTPEVKEFLMILFNYKED